MIKMVNTEIISVRQLSKIIKDTINDRPELSALWVRGELSNFKRHTSGHVYFSLKDEYSSIRAVMFKSKAAALKFDAKDGMDCLVRGFVSVYERDVAVQLYAEEIVPAGTGLQFLALEELKKKLLAKGYFSEKNKKKLPRIPEGVGVVTSQTGAAIRDIQNVIERRYPGMPVYLYPATVQGEKAVSSIVKGLMILNQLPDIDVIILARGGGSNEDLAVFNMEQIADAVYDSCLPVISAVGHEIDITIADLVADVRAATPTAAGELAVPVKNELITSLEKIEEKLVFAMSSKIDKDQLKLNNLSKANVFINPDHWLRRFREVLERKEVQLYDSYIGSTQKIKSELQIISGKLHALSPLDTLARGYSICKTQQGEILTDSALVSRGDPIKIKLHRGLIESVVTEKEHEPNA